MPKALAIIFTLLFTIAAAGQTPPPQGSSPGQPVQPPRDTQAAQTGSSIIRGRVLAADTGSPLRRAEVRLTARELREARATTTDSEGRYEFVELPAGRYTITASKGSYVDLMYGQQRPFEGGKPLELHAAEVIEKVDFRLPRGGVVTGRILDEYGEPAANVSVSAMRYAFTQGRRQLTNVLAGRTNDIGEYRIFGLPPGQYYISATYRSLMGAQAVTTDRTGYAPTYYPGTVSSVEAQRVTVTVGQTTGNVNFALTSVRVARVSGTVIDADGKPAGGGFMQVLERTAAYWSVSMGTQVRADGTFAATGVPPGEYTLSASIGGSATTMPNVASTKVTVTGEDVDGLRLVANRLATAKGKFVLEGASSKPPLRGAELHLVAQTTDPGLPYERTAGYGTAKDDLTFEMPVRPGWCVVRLFGAPAGWYLKAVRLNGSDVTDGGIDFRPDQEIDSLDIVLTDAPATLAGMVTGDKRQPVSDYTVVAFSNDRERWTAGSRFVLTARPDQDGRYQIRGLPADGYYVVAVDYVEQGEWADPEYLDRIKTHATVVTIGDGETKTLDLKLVTGS